MKKKLNYFKFNQDKHERNNQSIFIYVKNYV